MEECRCICLMHLTGLDYLSMKLFVFMSSQPSSLRSLSLSFPLVGTEETVLLLASHTDLELQLLKRSVHCTDEIDTRLASVSLCIVQCWPRLSSLSSPPTLSAGHKNQQKDFCINQDLGQLQYLAGVTSQVQYSTMQGYFYTQQLRSGCSHDNTTQGGKEKRFDIAVFVRGLVLPRWRPTIEQWNYVIIISTNFNH